jgi:hypothetical protein
MPQVLNAAALGSLDRTDDARIVVQRLLELQPGITVATAIPSAVTWTRGTLPHWVTHCAAGQPEG